jgi:hypothetical protein
LIGAGDTYQPHEPTTSAHEPDSLSRLQSTGHSARRKYMPDQVMNKAVAEEIQLRAVEMVLPPST